MFKRLISIAALLLVIFNSNAQEFYIVKDGKPVQTIQPVINDSIIEVVELFNDYVKQITGTELEMKPKIGGGIQFLLLSADYTPSLYLSSIKDNDVLKDAFEIYQDYSGISFHATTITGLKNAVHSWMERNAGVRFFAHDAVVIPKSKSIVIKKDAWFDAPAFTFRTPYYYEATFQEYIDFHKITASPKDTEKPSWSVSNDWGLWVHTMHRLLPPELLFQEHPEYFALRNGIRIPDQVCLSNKDVLEIVCKNLNQEIKANPKAKYWSVSQMDNFNYCECDNCRRIDSIEGSPSGTVISFVNEVAKRFPDKVISTLAYQYTRKAPFVTKPLPNVNIMLCTIECNRNVPIAADTSAGSFYSDLRSWSAITDNILVWDYVINFSHLIAPFPNFHVLAPNLQLFNQFGVKMMFEQGLRGSSSGEFNELRCYMLSKLMWNPYLNVDSLMNDFIYGYYGSGSGKFIKEYISQMTENLLRSGKALTLYEPPYSHSTGFMSPPNLKGYFALFNQALEASKGDSLITHRVEMAMQPIKYAWLEVTKSLPFTNYWIFNKEGSHELKPENLVMLNDLVDRAVIHGPILFHETSLPPEEYRQIMNDYFKNGVVNHLAVGSKVDYLTSPNEQYLGNGIQTLIDGVRGTTAYQMLWQGWWGKDLEIVLNLKSSQSLKEVVVGYLDNNQSWIIAPRAVEVSLSNDGINFKPIGTVTNEKAGQKSPVYRGSLTVPLPDNLKAQYVKVKVVNFGKLPSWRGIDSDAWLFVDEIEVHSYNL